MKNAQVHRFQHFVAVSLPGNGETVYFTHDDAAQLTDALDACVRDIEARPFVESRFGTRVVELSNNGSRFK